MKKLCFLFVLLLSSQLVLAQPGSEIYLFDLSVKKSKVTASDPVNITKHKGYDNQPSFHPELPQLFYSSANDDGRTDIVSYDYKKQGAKKITETSEKEYSPTVTLDQQFLSCIIQRDNGAQDLGKYPIEGGEPSVIIDNLTIGYHVWADNSHLGLFVLGTPNKLHYLLLPIKKDTIIAENIGKSLHKVPNEPAISFVQKLSDKWIIRKLNTQTMVVTTLMNTLPDQENITWTPDGKLLTTDGTKLYFADPAKDATWRPLEISSGADVIKGASRLAVSADGKKLAVVVSE